MKGTLSGYHCCCDFSAAWMLLPLLVVISLPPSSAGLFHTAQILDGRSLVPQDMAVNWGPLQGIADHIRIQVVGLSGPSWKHDGGAGLSALKMPSMLVRAVSQNVVRLVTIFVQRVFGGPVLDLLQFAQHQANRLLLYISNVVHD